MNKATLVNLVRNNSINQALDLLVQMTAEHDPDSCTQLILLNAQINSNENFYNKGLIVYSEFSLNHNRHINSLLLMIESIAVHEYFTAFQAPATDTVYDRKTKILFIAANPTGTTPLQLEKEYLEIRKIFKDKRNRFEITEVFNTTLDGLFEAIQTEKPDILHIAAPSNENYLLLHRADDTPHSIPYEFLASVFVLFQSHLKCIILNTHCSTIFLRKVSLYGGCAIGAPSAFSDTDSILFSSGFYTALAQGEKIEDAYIIGNQIISNHFSASAFKSVLNYLPPSPSFVMFHQGLSHDPDDQTPLTFPSREPDEITRALIPQEGKR